MKAIAKIVGGVGRMGGPSRVTPGQLVAAILAANITPPTGKETE